MIYVLQNTYLSFYNTINIDLKCFFELFKYLISLDFQFDLFNLSESNR